MPQRMNSYCRWHLVKLCVFVCVCLCVTWRLTKIGGVGGLDGSVRLAVLSM